MEDLGHIDINIKSMGGMGGASGAPGGGPGALAALNPLGMAANGMRQQMQTLPSIRTAMESLRRSITRGTVSRAAVAQTGTISSIGGELRDFISRPTIAGFSEITKKGSATGNALGALAGSGGKLAAGLMLGAAAIGVSVVAFKMLQKAVDYTRERIAEVGRFSAAVTVAQATERVAALSRSLREAEENGWLYAAAQRADTEASDQLAMVWRDLSKIIAVGSMVFSAWIKNTVAQLKLLVLPLTLFAKGIKAVTGYVMSLAAGFKMPEWIAKLREVFAKLEPYMKKILDSLGIIEDNTSGRDTKAANAWFMADVRAITGKPY